MDIIEDAVLDLSEKAPGIFVVGIKGCPGQLGKIVPVDIEIVPSSRIFHKGEKLRVQIAGRYIREGWFEPLAWDTDNHGRQLIYTGGQYESFIQVPVIPPKYRAGDYVYR